MWGLSLSSFTEEDTEVPSSSVPCLGSLLGASNLIQAVGLQSLLTTVRMRGSGNVATGGLEIVLLFLASCLTFPTREPRTSCLKASDRLSREQASWMQGTAP